MELANLSKENYYILQNHIVSHQNFIYFHCDDSPQLFTKKFTQDWLAK